MVVGLEAGVVPVAGGVALEEGVAQAVEEVLQEAVAVLEEAEEEDFRTIACGKVPGFVLHVLVFWYPYLVKALNANM